MENLYRHNIAQLHEGLKSRAFTTIDLLRHYQKRIERIDPILNTLTSINPQVETEASASHERYLRGEARGPLDGIPCTIKDNIPARHMPCSWGSEVYRHEVPESEEPVVARLRAAGAIILGKTNCPEFTLEGYTGNQTFGVTGNPYNPQLTPGGSSGGAVAGVAAGLAAFAIGTDGGGSIRRPAGHTGLVGLKPSIGRIPRANTLPQIMFDLEVVGPLARSVADCRTIFEAVRGHDPVDARSDLVEQPVPDRRLNILLIEQFGDNPVDPAIRASIKKAAETLSELGHNVEPGPLPFDIGSVNNDWPLIGQAGLAWLAQTLGPRFEHAALPYQEMAKAGAARGAGEYLALISEILALRSAASQAFSKIDLILTPTAAAQPWQAERPFPEMIDGRPVGPRGHAIFTGWVNAIGHPAIALPAEPDEMGMPIGYQLVGGFGQEKLLLNLASEIEARVPWALRWPKLASTG